MKRNLLLAAAGLVGALEGMRTRAELALPGKFDVRAYHDFIVDQGLLPLDMLDKAVMEEFVRPRAAATTPAGAAATTPAG